MIDPSWRRIAGIHLEEDGTSGAVWLAHDKDMDVIHVHDACLFQREVLAVIAEGLIARGRWIPIAWPKHAKDFADHLLNRGCNMLPEPSDDTEAMAEVYALDIQERMRTGRFKADKRLQNWFSEFGSFYRADGKVPRSSHPLMSATRHAVAMLQYARRQGPLGKRRVNYPRISMI